MTIAYRISAPVTDSPLITSRRNPKVLRWRSWLKESQVRRSSDWLLLEGEHLVLAAIENGVALRQVWVDTEAAAQRQTLLDRLRARKVPIVAVSRSVLAAVSDTDNPQGVVAEAVKPHLELVLGSGDLVILDGVQEPGNVGAILRVAAAAGAAGVWLAPGSAQAWAPKTLRAAMGAHFVLPVREGEVPESVWRPYAQAGRLWVTAQHSHQGQSLFALDLRAPVAWVFGNEGQGVGSLWRARASGQIFLPMNPAVESLNVATAAAVILFEGVRQRGNFTG